MGPAAGPAERFVCVHGHFYQPPRENPWLEAVEIQDSAEPYHDWNERITAECYAPNGAARVLDAEGWIVKIVNNYERISFDVGPTLLGWLEPARPDVYRRILDADRESVRRFSGHGSAMAQAYNHAILPLANRRDKYTQVFWGLRDFEHRFGRAAEGMWLPETAVDLETLDVLAQLGIRFTVLAPHQAGRVREIGRDTRRDVSGGRIAPAVAYRLSLGSGRTISLFFYDGPISRAIAFEGLLASGDALARRLTAGFSGARGAQLVHVATDGETYGHHHPHGDMALAYALEAIESGGAARLTNYGEYLARHGAAQDVEIVENTSWSCPHGVERWRSDCGCHSGDHPGWSQAWRHPLRAAFDWLRDTLAPRWEAAAARLLADPWEARNHYIDVILDRSPASVDRFLDRHGAHPLDEAERSRALRLLELQRHALLMYTSCGWFFDDPSGIETVQVLQYAGRVLQLARPVVPGVDDAPFLEFLEQAKSNVPQHGDARRIYEISVKPAMVDLPRVGVHFAVRALFEPPGDETRVHCYRVACRDCRTMEAGEAKLIVGRATVTCDITRESGDVAFGVLLFGHHNVAGGVREAAETAPELPPFRDATEAFSRGDLPRVIRLLDREATAAPASLKALFRDEQRRVLTAILAPPLAEAETVLRTLYAHHASMLRFLADLQAPVPKAARTILEFVLDLDLRRAFATVPPDLERIRTLLREATFWGVAPDGAALGHTVNQAIERAAREVQDHPEEVSALSRLDDLVAVARTLPAPIELWAAQNVCFSVGQILAPKLRARAREGDGAARAWVDRLTALGRRLRVRLP